MDGHAKKGRPILPNAIKLENAWLEIQLIPEWGSNVIRLLDKQKNLQLLREPASLSEYHQQPILYGIPILFPPNRIADGRFVFNKHMYQLNVNEPEKQNHIHGFVHDKPWEVVESNHFSVKTRFQSENFPDVEQQFPHRFILDFTNILDHRSLRQIMQVQNLSTKEMPVGLGYHTTFRCSSVLDVVAPVAKRWQLNERNLPTGVLQDVSTHISVQSSLDDVFLVNPLLENVLHICDHESGIKIKYVCDAQFTQWVIYNQDAKSGFICPEPYTWVTNAPNLNLPFTWTGFQTVQPGETKTYVSEIIVD